MDTQEIKANLAEIQQTLEKMKGEDVDFIFMASKQNRGAFNGSPNGIGALLMWNMAKYPVIRQIVVQTVDYYLSHKQEIDKMVENDNPSHEIVEVQ